jgi:ankyrin repeat protein
MTTSGEDLEDGNGATIGQEVTYEITGVEDTELEAQLTGTYAARKNIHDAVNQGKLGKVRKYLERGVDPNKKDAKGWTPLHYAVKHGLPKMVKLLLDHGAVVDDITNDSDDSAVGIASSKGFLPIVLQLINKGATIESRNHDGDTALHRAVGVGGVKTAALLTAAGHNINIANKANETPLHVAAGTSHLESVRFLVQQRGINLEAKDISGNTPLLSAAVNDVEDIISFLANSGADVDAKDKHGMTPLHHCMVRGGVEAAISLLDAGANPHIADKNGFTPIDLVEAEALENVYKKSKDLYEKGKLDSVIKLKQSIDKARPPEFRDKVKMFKIQQKPEMKTVMHVRRIAKTWKRSYSGSSIGSTSTDSLFNAEKPEVSSEVKMANVRRGKELALWDKVSQRHSEIVEMQNSHPADFAHSTGSLPETSGGFKPPPFARSKRSVHTHFNDSPPTLSRQNSARSFAPPPVVRQGSVVGGQKSAISKLATHSRNIMMASRLGKKKGDLEQHHHSVADMQSRGATGRRGSGVVEAEYAANRLMEDALLKSESTESVNSTFKTKHRWKKATRKAHTVLQAYVVIMSKFKSMEESKEDFLPDEASESLGDSSSSEEDMAIPQLSDGRTFSRRASATGSNASRRSSTVEVRSRQGSFESRNSIGMGSRRSSEAAMVVRSGHSLEVTVESDSTRRSTPTPEELGAPVATQRSESSPSLFLEVNQGDATLERRQSVESTASDRSRHSRSPFLEVNQGDATLERRQSVESAASDRSHSSTSRRRSSVNRARRRSLYSEVSNSLPQTQSESTESSSSSSSSESVSSDDEIEESILPVWAYSGVQLPDYIFSQVIFPDQVELEQKFREFLRIYELAKKKRVPSKPSHVYVPWSNHLKDAAPDVDKHAAQPSSPSRHRSREVLENISKVLEKKKAKSNTRSRSAKLAYKPTGFPYAVPQPQSPASKAKNNAVGARDCALSQFGGYGRYKYEDYVGDTLIPISDVRQSGWVEEVFQPHP